MGKPELHSKVLIQDNSDRLIRVPNLIIKMNSVIKINESLSQNGISDSKSQAMTLYLCHAIISANADGHNFTKKVC